MSRSPQDFWTDFVRSMNPGPGPGAGVDHRAGPPPPGPFGFNFGPGPFGFPPGPPPPWGMHHGGPPGPPPGPGGHHRHPHGRRGGRHHSHHRHSEPEAGERAATADEAMPDAGTDNEKTPFDEKASATMRGDNDNEVPDPPEEAPGAPLGYDAHDPHAHGPWGGFGFGPWFRGGCGRGRGRRGRGWGGRHGHEGWQTYLQEAARAFQEGIGGQDAAAAEDDTFAPPVDVFSTGSGWVLHVALPGAKKEDVRVSWDADKGVLTIGGLIYRPGNEEFLAGLVSGERRVGMFEREVKLPPREEEAQAEGKGKESKDEIDSEGITAKMEDGILVVNVPCVEKEWTEVRKVDIM